MTYSKLDLLQTEAILHKPRAAKYVGDMSTKGIEFSINYSVIKKDKYKLGHVTLNATKFERKN